MKAEKSLLLVIFLISIFIAVSYGQNTYPSSCSLSSPNVVIPAGQLTTTIAANVSYFNYVLYTSGGIHCAYLNNTIPGSWSGAYPTQIYFTVGAGTYTPSEYLLWNTWYGTGQWCYGNTFNVSYEVTHGDCWAYCSKTSYPGGTDDKLSKWVSPGSTVNYTLSVTTFYISGLYVHSYAYIWGAGANDMCHFRDDGYDPYVEKSDSKTGSFTSTGGYVECHAVVDIPQGFQGGGQASAYISW